MRGRKTHDTDNSGLLRNMLASPSKIARIKSKGAVLDIASSYTYRVYPFRAKLSVGWLTTKLKLALLTVVSTLGPCRGTLVT